jgi:hypothetical protein
MNGKIVCDREQNFLPSRADCVEHAIIANILINGIVVDKKEMLILSFDLRDAFRNVFMNWPKNNMFDICISNNDMKVIMNSSFEFIQAFKLNNYSNETHR